MTRVIVDMTVGDGVEKSVVSIDTRLKDEEDGVIVNDLMDKLCKLGKRRREEDEETSVKRARKVEEICCKCEVGVFLEMGCYHPKDRKYLCEMDSDDEDDYGLSDIGYASRKRFEERLADRAVVVQKLSSRLSSSAALKRLTTRHLHCTDWSDDGGVCMPVQMNWDDTYEYPLIRLPLVESRTIGPYTVAIEDMEQHMDCPVTSILAYLYVTEYPMWRWIFSFGAVNLTSQELSKHIFDTLFELVTV